MRRFAAPRDKRAGFDLLGAQQTHDVGNIAGLQLREQRHARDHAPGDDKVSAMDVLGEGGGDDADG